MSVVTAKVCVMQADTFWQIIEAARGESGGLSDPDEVAEAAAILLASRSMEEIIEYQVFFEQLEDISYRWDLWAAAYLINGGCSDDGFDYFRGWLVAQGRTVWEAALVDPDSLAAAGAEPDEADGESVLSIALDAYDRRTGNRDAFREALPSREDRTRPAQPAGEAFDFDDEVEMHARLPRLSAIYLDDES